MKSFNVALDGPSGAGKSTVADRIAEQYGLHHLDTGAMYRAVGLALDEMNIPASESRQLQNGLDQINLNVRQGKVILNGRDVSAEIRKPEVSLLASRYSALPSVRKKLVAMQQNIASQKGYILDGRDICDVVLPDAEIKLYLDASPKARALRRQKQNEEAGIQEPFEKILLDIEERDARDRNREADPLKISDSAAVLDSSHLDLEQTVQIITGIIDRTLKETEL